MKAPLPQQFDCCFIRRVPTEHPFSITADFESQFEFLACTYPTCSIRQLLGVTANILWQRLQRLLGHSTEYSTSKSSIHLLIESITETLCTPSST